MTIALSLLLLVALLLVVGVPFWVCLGLGTVAMLAATGALPLTLVGEALFEGVDSFALIAIPLFILTGDVMVRSGLAYRLLGFAEASFGWLRAGLRNLHRDGLRPLRLHLGFRCRGCGGDRPHHDGQARQEKGYPKAYACALVAAGACTGILIPPSIAYIIIGLVLGISSATLFQAAFVPGVIILVAVVVTNAIVNRVRGYERSTAGFSGRGWLVALNDAKWALAIPVHHPGRHLLGRVHADRGGGRRRGRGPAHRHAPAAHPARAISRPCSAPPRGCAGWCCRSSRWRCSSLRR